ncbi:MAG: OmpH family outer membrane protein [Candidatus Babeliales bacterium]
MKKFLLLVAFALPLFAAEQTQLAIKVISGQEVLSQLEEGKDVEKILMEKRQKFETDIQSLEAEMKKIVDGMEAKRKIAKPEALEADQEKLLKMRRDHQNKGKEAEEELKRSFQKELGKLNQKIQAAVIKVAEKNNWDMVVLKETGEVVYASSKVNASDDIVTMMNREFTIKATPAKPAEPAKSVKK